MAELIGVIGVGQMGRGIAQVAAQAGYDVVMIDRDKALADQSLAKLTKTLDGLVEKGKLDKAARDETVKHLSVATDYSGLKNAVFVIEAVTENIDVKHTIFKQLSETVPESCVLASNTSSISLTKIATVAKNPERVIGMHFFNPVPLMGLVEIVNALQTSTETYKKTSALAEKMQKKVVTSKDAPGFMVNRMLMPFLMEACFALQEGVGNVEDIDTSAKLGLNHPMGPFELADFVGLDTCLYVSEVLMRELGDSKYRPPTILRNYVAAGWHGRKTGKGFYDYSVNPPKPTK